MNLKGAVFISVMLTGSLTANILQFGETQKLKAENYRKTIQIGELATQVDKLGGKPSGVTFQGWPSTGPK
jgi:hypothetical protein